MSLAWSSRGGWALLATPRDSEAGDIMQMIAGGPVTTWDTNKILDKLEALPGDEWLSTVTYLATTPWDLGDHVIAVWDNVANAEFSGSSGITVQ